MPSVLAPTAPGFRQCLASASPSQASRTRRQALLCAAGQGFGGDKPSQPAASKSKKKGSKAKKQVSRISSDQAVERAVRIAEGGAPRPVSGKEAAKGRLDYVQVKDWGSGDRKDLGSLEVDSVTTARGDLNPPPGSKPLPPFEKWAFRKRHFLQYLADLLQVHYALEAATLAALQPSQEGLPDEKDSESADSMLDPALLTGAFDTSACHALGCFTEGSGLWRSGAISRDLHEIARHTTGDVPTTLEASPHADAYAEDLVATASVAQQEDLGVERQDEARLRLLAHIYSAHVAHFTTGMRIGAAATERLDLFSIGATSMYQAYPDDMEDPLRVFIDLVNTVGASLSPKERAYVMAELPTAFYATSQLLTALARSD